MLELWKARQRWFGRKAQIQESNGCSQSLFDVTVLYGDNGYMFHKCSNVAKKIDAWIQKERRDSQYYGCTVRKQD